MKVVILAGGQGTRLAEESVVRPKPMVDIGDRPILWHIMKIYAAHGMTDFVICLGYKGYVIKEYFFNYALHSSDVTVDIARGDVHRSRLIEVVYDVAHLEAAIRRAQAKADAGLGYEPDPERDRLLAAIRAVVESREIPAS